MDYHSGEGTSESQSTPASDLRRQASSGQADEQHLVESDESGASEVDEAEQGKNGSKPKKPRSTHACQACRRMKIRCEPLEDRDSCKQCAKVNRECLVTEPRRKRQKTVHRVTELEKKIDALTASLKAKTVSDERKWIPPSLRAREDGGKSQKNAEMNSHMAQEYLDARGTENSGQHQIQKEENQYVDVIDRGVIDEQTAYRAFQRYQGEMCQYFPVVVFPPATTGYEIRSRRPYLFLSILTAAISTFRSDLQSILCDELTFILADKIVYRGDRSFELVQAMLVLMQFYSRPKHQTELNFNQIIHIAATMCLDLGMGRRSKRGPFGEKSLFPGIGVAEVRRTWLACYYMCANCAMSLRHPIFIRWSPYIEESIEFLSSSSEALPSDAWLCELVKLQHIGEEVAFVFSMDDPAFGISLSDPKTHYHLKTFERQLSQWRQNSKVDLSTPWTRHIEAAFDLYIHEIAIHFDHNVDDFRPPPLMADNGPEDLEDMITPAHVDSLITCIDSIHKLLDAFFEIDIDTIRNLPNMFFVRNAYATVALIKIEGVFRSRGSKFESLFSSNLRVEQYIETMIDVLRKAAEGQKSIVAFGFGFVFRRLKQWYTGRQDVGLGSCPGSQEDSQQQTQKSLFDYVKGAPLHTFPRPDMTTANLGPTAAVVTESMDIMMPFDVQLAPANDTTMYNLGLPQFYDFGFTFDDMGLADNMPNDPGLYPFTMP